jgi:hypothetical protein
MHEDLQDYGKWLRSRVYEMPEPEQWQTREERDSGCYCFQLSSK